MKGPPGILEPGAPTILEGLRGHAFPTSTELWRFSPEVGPSRLAYPSDLCLDLSRPMGQDCLTRWIAAQVSVQGPCVFLQVSRELNTWGLFQISSEPLYLFSPTFAGAAGSEAVPKLSSVGVDRAMALRVCAEVLVERSLESLRLR